MVIKAQSPAGFAEEYIIESIWNNRFPPGSILPAERELSELIGVTRTTLREVLQRLARDGWLTIQHGKPTKINNFWETSGLNILETIARLDHESAPKLIENLLAAGQTLRLFLSVPRFAITRSNHWKSSVPKMSRMITLMPSASMIMMCSAVWPLLPVTRFTA